MDVRGTNAYVNGWMRMSSGDEMGVRGRELTANMGLMITGSTVGIDAFGSP